MFARNHERGQCFSDPVFWSYLSIFNDFGTRSRSSEHAVGMNWARQPKGLSIPYVILSRGYDKLKSIPLPGALWLHTYLSECFLQLPFLVRTLSCQTLHTVNFSKLGTYISVWQRVSCFLLTNIWKYWLIQNFPLCQALWPPAREGSL